MSENKSIKNAIDSLTQMPNRGGWQSLAETAIQNSRQHCEAKAVLFIDLDRFKWVNDSLGHDAGDELLKIVAKLIKQNLRGMTLQSPPLGDIPGRMGGDEFVVLLQDSHSVAECDVLANQLIEVISQPITLSEAEVEIGASIGIAHFPGDSQHLTELIKFADLAMYRAKHSGRNQVVHYQPEMIRQIEYRRTVQSAIRQALRDDLFSLVYQPIYDCKQHEVVAIEAQLNVETCLTLSTLEQSELFAIADESQVSVLLSEWIVEKGLAFIEQLEENGESAALVVPVRPSHFHQKSFIDWLEQTLDNYGISPEKLVLSLDDTCLNVQRFPVEKQLNLISKLGVEIAVNNFGAGNLSPLRLHDWPIDRLHLSSIFVSEITQKRSMESMAIALVQMGLTLNKQVVAYGVRTAEQQAFLTSQQCEIMQGPYFGEPLEAAEMELELMHDGDDELNKTRFLDAFGEEY